MADTLRVVGNGQGGQGRLDDPLLRRKVELAAMTVVHRWLVSSGHSRRSIRDTSATCPYDFEVVPAQAPKFRVEVKCTIGEPGPVFVTAGEVRAAREGGVRTVLAIVYNLELALQADGTWEVHGGCIWYDEDWRPSDEALEPTQYRWEPNYSNDSQDR